MNQAIQSVYEVPGLYIMLEKRMNHYDAIDAPTPMSRGYAMGASILSGELLEYYGDDLRGDLVKDLNFYKSDKKGKRVEAQSYADGAIATIELVLDEIDNR